MTTDENKPSPGAITTAGAIQAAQDSKGLPTEDWARIIDAHTNAIADELNIALVECLRYSDRIRGDVYDLNLKVTQGSDIDLIRAALARYNAAKSKELK